MVKDEVNVVDFLAMTAVQVFIPDVYYGIRDNKEVFSGIYSDRLHSSEKLKEHDVTICDSVLKKVNFPTYEILKDFFQRLFPKLESIYGNMGYSYSFLENWRKEGRVCSQIILILFSVFQSPRVNCLKRKLSRFYNSETM